MATIVRSDEFIIDNSKMTVDIISDITYEDLVIFKAQARLQEKLLEQSNLDAPTYREVRTWLVKGI